jgi:putative hydrolase of HD superfamily
MECKGDNPASRLAGTGAQPIVEAYFELCHLKQLYRQGWLKRGVPKERCESIAEHSFGVALLGLWLSAAYFPELDAGKVLRMALLHDLGEIYAGDIIPGDNISAEEKHRREAQSVERVLGKLPKSRDYLACWQEFELGQTAEARFVRQVDRLEMGLQAGVYASQGFENLDEFFASARQGLSDPALVELIEAVQVLSKDGLDTDFHG